MVSPLGMGRDKGRRLSFDQLWLERLEDTLCFGQRKAPMLDPLVRLLHDRDFLDGDFCPTPLMPCAA
jgi:hypothetical protein